MGLGRVMIPLTLEQSADTDGPELVTWGKFIKCVFMPTFKKKSF
jgi:hypothetical protein